MHALIGLGNPGLEYDGTRHNVGFRVMDAVSEVVHARLSSGGGEYLIAKTNVRERHTLLVKPLTYMNNSGRAVADLIGKYKIALENILVICDDFQLPLGTLRLRPKGSDGGHNGLYSIIYHVQSEQFPRLRCGIASRTMPKKKSEMAQFVLSVFDKDEESMVKEMVNRARDAALTFITEGINMAMNKFNTSQ